MSDIVYGYADFYNDIEGVIDLCATWWNDSAFYKNTGMPFEVDREQFEQFYLSGMLVAVVGKEEITGKIVSCYIGVKSPYYFNKNYLMCNEVVWCLHKDYRKGREVFNLIKAIEMAMKGNRINIYNLCLPILEGKETLEKYMIKKLGFFTQDSTLMKEVIYG